MNRTEVLEKLQPVMGLKVHEVEHGPRTRLQVTPEEVIFNPGNRSRALTIAPEAVREITNFTGVGERLAKELRPTTFSLLITELLAAKGRYVLLAKEQQVVGIGKAGQYRPVNAERVLGAIERAIGESTDYARVSVLSQSVYIEVVGDKQEAVAKGDLVQAGALVAFSPIGIINPSVQTYVRRLTCTNGATANYVLEGYGYGEGDDLWQWFRKSIGRAYRSVGRVTERWQQMAREQVSPAERAAMLEALIKHSRLDKVSAEAVRARALEQPPTSAYDIHQLLTWATSHVVEDAGLRIRAQAVAADFSHEETHARVCPVCRR